MKNNLAAKQLRQELDATFKKWRRVIGEPPKGGWIMNIREALGISTHQLADRLKMSQSGLVVLQQSEVKKTIQLSSLKKVAKALNCDLVYALVPKESSLEKTLADRRQRVAEHALHGIIKKSDLSAAERRALIDAYGKKIKPKKLWGRLKG